MKKIVRTYLWVCITSAIFIQFAIAESMPQAIPQSNPQVITTAQIDAVVESAMKTFNVPGISVAVIKDDQVVHSKGYGVRSIKSKLTMDAHTLVGIASNSKAFTAAALAMLVDEKKLRWNERVTNIIPEFKLYNPYVTDEFTVLDLMTHRSGLGLGAGDLMFFPDGSDFTLKDVIHNLRFLKPVSSFRSKYDYDNNLYIVAGEVIKRVSGMSWEEFVEQRIMKPLAMNESAASITRLKHGKNQVDPHVPVNGVLQTVPFRPNEVINAAGGIYSNIHDMSLWVRMQLNKGAYGSENKQRLFSEKVQHEMWSPQTILQTGTNTGTYNTHFAAYGIGWGLSDVKGYKQVAHTGGLLGMVTQVTLIPEIKLGIIVLTNQESGAAFTSITNTIKDSYLGMPVIDRVKETHERQLKRDAENDKEVAEVWKAIEAQQKSKTSNRIDQSIYLGTYRDNWFGEVSIRAEHGKMIFSAKRSPALTGEMQFYKGNTFIVRWNDRTLNADAFVNFVLDVEGKPVSMSMKAISPATDFSFDFHDLDFHLVKP